MDLKDVLADLRKKTELSQSDLADRLHVTRQAVSRWERGETMPNVETLQALSKLFGVSINTLLGSPRTLVCQSCGMPLSDELLARDADGTFNEKNCKWCWSGGGFTTECTLEEMIEQCLQFMPGGMSDPEAGRAYMQSLLPGLERWNRE